VNPRTEHHPFHVRITSEDSDEAEGEVAHQPWVVDIAHVAPGAAWVTEISYTDVPEQLTALAHLLCAPTAPEDDRHGR
jgi:hypothetical protein